MRAGVGRLGEERARRGAAGALGAWHVQVRFLHAIARFAHHAFIARARRATRSKAHVTLT